jgi:hypothetical protein
MKDLATREKRGGFDKIRKTCARAAGDGLKYSWVDTCCIDKTSSGELSEAINSMSKWYRASAVCYAYLSDLKIDDADQQSEDSVWRQLDDKLPRCRWFTRGWTLQELIAPVNMRFFDSSWAECGARVEERMRNLLHSITGIPTNVMLDPDERLSHISAARKLSWAARRQTSRTEDVAYCLMGIFDINMPMIYGEGRKAFCRLQEEILRKTGDMSILAWETDEDFDLHGVLADSPADFNGSSFIDRLPVSSEKCRLTISNDRLIIQGCPALYVNPNSPASYALALPCANYNLTESERGTIHNPKIQSISIRKTSLGFVRDSPRLRCLTALSIGQHTTTLKKLNLFPTVEPWLKREMKRDKSVTALARSLGSPDYKMEIHRGFSDSLFDMQRKIFLLGRFSSEYCFSSLR